MRLSEQCTARWATHYMYYWAIIRHVCVPPKTTTIPTSTVLHNVSFLIFGHDVALLRYAHGLIFSFSQLLSKTVSTAMIYLCIDMRKENWRSLSKFGKAGIVLSEERQPQRARIDKIDPMGIVLPQHNKLKKSPYSSVRTALHRQTVTALPWSQKRPVHVLTKIIIMQLWKTKIKMYTIINCNFW